MIIRIHAPRGGWVCLAPRSSAHVVKIVSRARYFLNFSLTSFVEAEDVYSRPSSVFCAGSGEPQHYRVSLGYHWWQSLWCYLLPRKRRWWKQSIYYRVATCIIFFPQHPGGPEVLLDNAGKYNELSNLAYSIRGCVSGEATKKGVNFISCA